MMQISQDNTQTSSILGSSYEGPGSLKLEFLSKKFTLDDTHDVDALKDVNLTVTPGEFLAIMGFSGSGKSTLLNILGLLDKPTSGKYYIGSNDVDKLSKSNKAKLRRNKFGFIFQDFNLLNRYTVEQNIVMGLAYQSISKKTARRLALNLLDQLGLSDKASVNPQHLSGGQAQRIAIARALINNPPILLADEPTGNLDGIATEEIVGLLKNLSDKGTTVVMVTHDSNVAAAADRVITMKAGQIIQEVKT